MLPLNVIAIRLFLRLFVGVMLLSVGVSKLTHPRQFEQGIQDYQLVPRVLQAKSGFSMALAAGIPAGQGGYYITYTYQAGCEPNCQFLNGASCAYACSCV